ncbi:MAG: peptide deformylase [Candidatus Methylomirabilales bacterium]
MAIRKVALMGHPVLRQIAEPVPDKQIRTPGIQQLIDDMVETMREYSGVGLAAPQVYEPLQIVIIEKQELMPEGEEATRTKPQVIPLTVLINPVVTAVTDAIAEDWEGCLSIPDIRGKVPRHTEVQVEALDRVGAQLRFTAKDFYARAIQHEHDHLQGILFLDRMKSLETLTYLVEFQRYWAPRD